MKKSIWIWIIVAVVVIVAGVVLAIFLMQQKQLADAPKTPQGKPLTSTLYKPVDDLCSVVDLTSLEGYAGEATETKNSTEENGAKTCNISLKGVKQPDGADKTGAYNVEVSVRFSGESDTERLALGETWRKDSKDAAREKAAVNDQIETFAEIDNVGDEAYSVRTLLKSIGMLIYEESVWTSNLAIDVSVAGRLTTDIKGDEYNAFTREILEGTMKKLE